VSRADRRRRRDNTQPPRTELDERNPHDAQLVAVLDLDQLACVARHDADDAVEKGFVREIDARHGASVVCARASVDRSRPPIRRVNYAPA